MGKFFSKTDLDKCVCSDAEFMDAKNKGSRYSYSEEGKTVECYLYKGKYYYVGLVTAK